MVLGERRGRGDGLGLRQLLLFTGRRVEELLRVLDHPGHGVVRDVWADLPGAGRPGHLPGGEGGGRDVDLDRSWTGLYS